MPCSSILNSPEKNKRGEGKIKREREMIQNIIFDMGNVLLEYNPQVSLDYFAGQSGKKTLSAESCF